MANQCNYKFVIGKKKGQNCNKKTDFEFCKQHTKKNVQHLQTTENDENKNIIEPEKVSISKIEDTKIIVESKPKKKVPKNKKVVEQIIPQKPIKNKLVLDFDSDSEDKKIIQSIEKDKQTIFKKVEELKCSSSSSFEDSSDFTLSSD